MKVFLERSNENITISIDGKKSLKEVLFDLKISIESVILIKNNEICLEDEFVCDSDNIKILSVVSGG